MHDPLDCRPQTDDYTADVLDTALYALAWLRGHDRDPDPAIRLHLLTSLRDQLHAELLHTTLEAHHHGYDPTQLATILDLDG